MEFQALMTVIIGMSRQLAGWLETAKEIAEVEKAGGAVSAELRGKAKAAGDAAQAAMDALR